MSEKLLIICEKCGSDMEIKQGDIEVLFDFDTEGNPSVAFVEINKLCPRCHRQISFRVESD